MTRVSPPMYAGLDNEQEAVWEALVDPRGGGLGITAPDGTRVGPFPAFVHAPRSAVLARSAPAAPDVDRPSEIAICAVGAPCQSAFWAHAPTAIERAVSESVIAAMPAGHRPESATTSGRCTTSSPSGSRVVA